MSTRAASTAAARPGGRKERVQTSTKIHTESSHMATRGRRKLDFSFQRFRGKVFFLDLAGYKRGNDLERELTQRGATVEKFFNRGVKYLVTNRGKGRSKMAASSQSPSTPSPQTPGTVPSVRSAASHLVYPADSPSSVAGVQGVPAHYTRAQRLVHLSNSGKKLDIIAKAGEWGCKVVSLEELLAELKKLPALPQSKSEAGGGPRTTANGRQAKVRKLVSPFLKVEDLSRGYCPLVYEGKGVWPRPDVMCSPRGCPYDTPNKHSRPGHAPPPVAAVRASVTKPAESQTAVFPETKERKPGYCECCATRYSDLAMHLRSAKHLEYATDNSNFSRLDVLIAQGTSFKDFVSSLRAKRCVSQRATTMKAVSPAKPAKPVTESVVLVTPPHTPANKGKGRRSPMKSPSVKAKQRKSPAKTPTRGQRKSGSVSPGKAMGKSTTPTRGQRKSPAKTPIRGQASPILTPSTAKKIIKLEGDFISPKHGELCITPISPKSFTVTPGWGARVNAIADRLTNRIVASSPNILTSTPVVEHHGTKRKLCGSHVSPTPPTKRQHRSQTVDLVPETPDRISEDLRRHSSPLCKLSAALNRSKEMDQACGAKVSHDFASPKATSQKRSCDSSSSPATALRKSPRLIEQERKQKLKVKTSNVKKFSLPSKHSLTVSYQLSKVFLRSKRLTTPTTHRDDPLTPEISLQGVLPLKQSIESPLLGLARINNTEVHSAASSNWSFAGFTPNSVGRSVPQFAMMLRSSPAVVIDSMERLRKIQRSTGYSATSDWSFNGFTPNSVQNAMPAFTMSLRSSPKSGYSEMMKQEAEKDGVVTSHSLRKTRLSFADGDKGGYSSPVRKPGYCSCVKRKEPGSE